ncbi:hypothetical protein VCBJG01_3282 [Vibrio cholerae BJG-01]|nr:hypothetical protein VCBJG01_3282 [Vibrio cholerae BJG-01]
MKQFVLALFVFEDIKSIILLNVSIPFLLEAAAVLAMFVHPNHIVYLCSWG